MVFSYEKKSDLVDIILKIDLENAGFSIEYVQQSDGSGWIFKRKKNGYDQEIILLDLIIMLKLDYVIAGRMPYNALQFCIYNNEVEFAELLSKVKKEIVENGYQYFEGGVV